jgi:hypothetical protein
VVPRTWSLAARDGHVFITHNDVTDSLDIDEIEHVAVAELRGADGSATEWTALYGRLRSGPEVPLAWLTTKRVQPITPGLKEAVNWFPAEMLSAELVELKEADAAAWYWTVGEQRDLADGEADGPLTALILAVALFCLGHVGPGVLCVIGALVMLAVSINRASLRRAARTMPSGHWSLSVGPDSLLATVNGVATRLSREDVEEAELRPLPGPDGRATLFMGLQLRLRSGTQAADGTEDGWLTVYPKPVFDASAIPIELLAVLDEFTGQRFGTRLARATRRRLKRYRVAPAGSAKSDVRFP